MFNMYNCWRLGNGLHKAANSFGPDWCMDVHVGILPPLGISRKPEEVLNLVCSTLLSRWQDISFRQWPWSLCLWCLLALCDWSENASMSIGTVGGSIYEAITLSVAKMIMSVMSRGVESACVLGCLWLVLLVADGDNALDVCCTLIISGWETCVH